MGAILIHKKYSLAYPESISADVKQAENGRAVGTWHPWQLSLLLMKSVLVSC